MGQNLMKNYQVLHPYLLAKLYAVPEYHHSRKMKRMIALVLTKEPKIYSTAIEEMRE
jgi:hypothetical protein